MKKYGAILWLSILAAIATFLILPQTNSLFVSTTASHPYIMGFIKFAILSIMGEFLALRVVTGEWRAVKGMAPKMFIWGLLGVLIVLMFKIYSSGISGAAESGLLYDADGSALMRAFWISAVMNLTFGPVFMAAHRITDTYIDNKIQGKKMGWGECVSSIDWSGFIKFVVFKTIPLFWIPAHTITFMLPGEYKVLFAASLSIVLGLILSYAKLKAAKK